MYAQFTFVNCYACTGKKAELIFCWPFVISIMRSNANFMRSGVSLPPFSVLTINCVNTCMKCIHTRPSRRIKYQPMLFMQFQLRARVEWCNIMMNFHRQAHSFSVHFYARHNIWYTLFTWCIFIFAEDTQYVVALELASACSFIRSRQIPRTFDDGTFSIQSHVKCTAVFPQLNQNDCSHSKTGGNQHMSEI